MDNLSIIISSCQKYSDLWEENITLFKKNWPDASCRTTLVTDFKGNHKIDFELFEAGNMELPNRICKYLETVRTEYVLWLQDDYFLTTKIDTSRIIKVIQKMKELDLDYLRLYEYPRGGKRIEKKENIKWLKLDRTYDVNMYPSIWRLDFIKEAYNRNVSIWELEASLTSFAIEHQKKCAMIHGQVFPFLDVVEKGKLHYKAYKFFVKYKIETDREHMTLMEEIIHQLRFHSRSFIPKPLFNIIKQRMIKHGEKFYSDSY